MSSAFWKKVLPKHLLKNVPSKCDFAGAGVAHSDRKTCASEWREKGLHRFQRGDLSDRRSLSIIFLAASQHVTWDVAIMFYNESCTASTEPCEKPRNKQLTSTPELLSFPSVFRPLFVIWTDLRFLPLRISGRRKRPLFGVSQLWAIVSLLQRSSTSSLSQTHWSIQV